MAFLLVKYSLVAVNISLSSSVLMRFLLTVFPGFFNDSGHGQPPWFPYSACIDLLRLLKQNTTDCVASISEFFFFFCTVEGARSLKVPSGLVSGDASLATSSLYPTWTLLLHTGEKRELSSVKVFLWGQQSNQIRAPSLWSHVTLITS